MWVSATQVNVCPKKTPKLIPEAPSEEEKLWISLLMHVMDLLSSTSREFSELMPTTSTPQRNLIITIIFFGSWSIMNPSLKPDEHLPLVVSYLYRIMQAITKLLVSHQYKKNEMGKFKKNLISNISKLGMRKGPQYTSLLYQSSVT